MRQWKETSSTEVPILSALGGARPPRTPGARRASGAARRVGSEIVGIAGVEPRLNQTALALLSLVDDANLRSRIAAFLRDGYEGLAAERERQPAQPTSVHMNRQLAPVFQSIRDALEAELLTHGFHLASETIHYDAFGSGSAEYARRGMRVELTYDGKDRWAWVTYAAQPTPAFLDPMTYRDLDAGQPGSPTYAPSLRSPRQAAERAAQLISRLRLVLADSR